MDKELCLYKTMLSTVYFTLQSPSIPYIMETISIETFFSSHILNPMFVLVLMVFAIVRSIWIAKQSNSFISWPIFGMLPSYLLALRSGFHEATTNVLQEENGTFTLEGPWFCDFEYVGTTDPRNLEHILKANFYNFRKGHSTCIIMHDFLGDSFFSMDDEVWRWLRKVVNMKLVMVDFNRMAMETFVKLVQTRLLPIADSFVEQSVVIDLQAVLSRLLFDQNCKISLGVDPGCLTPGLPVVQFAKAFKKAEEVTALRFFFPVFVWKLMRYFNLGAERELKTAVHQINEFAYDVITKRKMELSSETSDTKLRSDLLSLLMRTKDDHGNGYPDKFLRDNCFNIMFAGSDTSAVALTWFFWLLHQNPIAEKQIYAEICSIMGKPTSLPDKEKENIGAILSPEKVKKMQYLHAAITESLRLYPPVPLNQSEVYNDDQLPSGVKVRKGVRVITSMYAMGRMESIWGKDCREFKPERWLRNGSFMPESQYKFPAFNAGLRNCLGKDLGYYQMKVVAASLIYRYRVIVVENQTVLPRLSMMLHMKHGLKVSLNRRNESDSDYVQ